MIPPLLTGDLLTPGNYENPWDHILALCVRLHEWWEVVVEADGPGGPTREQERTLQDAWVVLMRALQDTGHALASRRLDATGFGTGTRIKRFFGIVWTVAAENVDAKRLGVSQACVSGLFEDA